MKRLKEKILEDNQLPTSSYTGNSTPSTSSSAGNSTPSTSSSTGNSTPSTPSHAERSNETYVYGADVLMPLPSYFLHITLPRLQIKTQSMKNRINHQKDVICFRSDDLYNKMSNCSCQKNIKKPIGDGLLITTVAATAAGIFFGLRAVGVRQQSALLTSALLVYLMSLPVWKM